MSTPSAKRTGWPTNKRRTQLIEKLQSRRKARQAIQRSDSIQLAQRTEPDPISPHPTAQEEPDPIAPHPPTHDEPDPTVQAQPSQYKPEPVSLLQSAGDGPAGLHAPSPMAGMLSSLLGLPQPGGHGGGGPNSLLNTLAMMGIPLPGLGGPSSAMSVGNRGLVQAGAHSSGMELMLGNKLSELARLNAELAGYDQQMQGPPKMEIPTHHPEDEKWEQNPLPASILDMLAVVNGLREARDLQIDVEGSLALRLEGLTDSEEDANSAQHIKVMQSQLEAVRGLTEKQLEILDGFAKRAEASVAAVEAETTALQLHSSSQRY